MPASSVTANARSAPSRPENVPLADKIAEPAAIRMLPKARRRADRTCRVAAEVRAGFAPRSTRHADHAAPTKMTRAGMDEPTAARMRGRASKCSLPVGKVSGSMAPWMGATNTTPAANPLNTRRTRVVTWPARGPASRNTVPNPNHGTLMMAPKVKKMRKETVLQP